MQDVFEPVALTVHWVLAHAGQYTFHGLCRQHARPFLNVEQHRFLLGRVGSGLQLVPSDKCLPYMKILHIGLVHVGFNELEHMKNANAAVQPLFFEIKLVWLHQLCQQLVWRFAVHNNQVPCSPSTNLRLLYFAVFIYHIAIYYLVFHSQQSTTQ